MTTAPKGMDDDAEARFHTSVAEARRIAQKRRDMARRLTAPPAPAEAVKDAWAPLQDTIADRRTAGGK